MPSTGRLLAVALTLAFGAAHAAEPGQDALTTPNSPLYKPSPEIRAQVRDAMGHRQPRPAHAPSAAELEAIAPDAVAPDAVAPGPAALPEAGSTNPLPRGLVATAQRELAAYGYDPGPIDGRAGPKTRQAVKAFQTDKGLPADGQLTFDLLAKLMVRAAPAITPPPPPPPPAPPAVQSFSVRRVLGKAVHAQAGDLLGVVGDFVVGADRTLVGVVVDTTNGYGTDEGKVVVPFTQVGHAITRAAVILPLPAHKALPLRDKAQKVELSEGQWLLSSALGDGDITADTDGKLLTPAAAK